MAEVDVDSRKAQEYVRRMFNRAEDFKPVFRWARRELEKANRKNFASEGTASGKPWMPLDDEYARWKLESYGPLPILVVNRTLESSLTSLRGKPNEIDKKNAWFGTNIPHARYHQDGTRHMPARKIVFVPPLFARALAEQTAEYVVHGTIGTGTPLPVLKGLF